MLSPLEIESVFVELPTLRCERVNLVPLHLDHAEQLFELYSMPEDVSGVGRELHATPAATQQWVLGLLEQHRTYTGMTWSLFQSTRPRLIGSCALHGISWRNRRADVGFELAPDLWGQGLMREALTALLRFAFTDLEFIKLSAHVALDNERSHGLLGRLGFREEGVLRRHGFWGGQAHDLKAYGLLSEELAGALSGRSSARA
jgi:[ribosomal protein S5]-alanine N-acetyltransferase